MTDSACMSINNISFQIVRLLQMKITHDHVPFLLCTFAKRMIKSAHSSHLLVILKEKS